MRGKANSLVLHTLLRNRCCTLRGNRFRGLLFSLLATQFLHESLVLPNCAEHEFNIPIRCFTCTRRGEPGLFLSAVVGRARLHFITRPKSSELCILSSAAAASSGSSYSIKANPRCRAAELSSKKRTRTSLKNGCVIQVLGSMGRMMSTISPKGTKAACRMDSVTCSSNPP